ncbi:MAG: 3-isopropylmalate dehydratase small subunit [Betaproteobacteria bacterium]
MEPLIELSSVVLPLIRDNVDTDAIIPAAYMRSLATDPATGLFGRWRYRADGSDDPDFVLNDPRYRGTRILLSGANFGCGSSRENAVWALERYGIRCVIALGFSDIFHENCFKNGVLPIVAAPRDHERLVQLCTQAQPAVARIDVKGSTIATAGGDTLHFDLDQRKRALLMNGTDEIDVTLASGARIREFRKRHRRDKPWLYANGDRQ